MMDFLTSGPIASALAPKVEVGQEALYDALRARDETRALRIIKRVSNAARDGAGARGNAPRIPEVREGLVWHQLIAHRNFLEVPRDGPLSRLS